MTNKLDAHLRKLEENNRILLLRVEILECQQKLLSLELKEQQQAIEKQAINKKQLENENRVLLDAITEY